MLSIILGAGNTAVKKTVMVPALMELPLWYTGPSPGFMLESLGEL